MLLTCSKLSPLDHSSFGKTWQICDIEAPYSV